ncbi:Heme-binding-like protein At3g10130, chloroplastic [Linum grandiflorum]
MTAPVISKTAADSEQIAMTAPVISKTGGGMVTMEFILSAKYRKAEEAPEPVDERVVIREVGERKYGVVKFSGVASDDVAAMKVEKLKERLVEDGYKIVGEDLLARYNPPWLTLPLFRTNEIMVPVE